MRLILFAFFLSVYNLVIGQPQQTKVEFADKWKYAGIAIEDPGYTVWGASPILGEDGKVHLFAARWPGKAVDPGWRTHSEIAHYISDSPEGPFVFSEISIKEVAQEVPSSGSSKRYFAPHNPTIHKVDGKYALFYIVNDGIEKHPSNQVICLATSETLNGPWTKVGEDGIILKPSENPMYWTHKATNGVNNPAFIKHPGGGYFLYFKSEKAKMGLAISENLTGPYIQLPFPVSSNTSTIEDGYAFLYQGKFFLLTTDNHGMLEKGGGILWKSDDGIHFNNFEKGFHRVDDYIASDKSFWKVYYGSQNKEYAKFERPQILLIDGKPAYLYVASGTNIFGGGNTVNYVLKYSED